MASALRLFIFLTIGTALVPNHRVLADNPPSKAETITFLKRVMQDGIIIGLSNSRRHGRIDGVNISELDGRFSIAFRFEGGGRADNPGDVLFSIQDLLFKDGTVYDNNIVCKTGRCISVTAGSNDKQLSSVYIGMDSDEDTARMRRALYHLSSFFLSNPRDDYFR